MAADSADLYLKFEGEWGNSPLVGDCMDEKHPGPEGWIQIRSFSFGFGSGDNANASVARPANPGRGRTAEERVRELEGVVARQGATLAAQSQPAREQPSWGKSGPLDFERFSFSKSTDRISPILVEMSHGGDYKIPKITVEAVRYGGTGEDFKIPFVQLVFEQVYIKSVKLNLVSDEMPTEDIEFEYDIVKLHTLWTDNATGNRLPQEPIRIGWNIPKQELTA